MVRWSPSKATMGVRFPPPAPYNYNPQAPESQAYGQGFESSYPYSRSASLSVLNSRAYRAREADGSRYRLVSDEPTPPGLNILTTWIGVEPDKISTSLVVAHALPRRSVDHKTITYSRRCSLEEKHLHGKQGSVSSILTSGSKGQALVAYIGKALPRKKDAGGSIPSEGSRMKGL